MMKKIYGVRKGYKPVTIGTGVVISNKTESISPQEISNALTQNKNFIRSSKRTCEEECALITEKRWLDYCKGVKRKKWQGVAVDIILPNKKIISGEKYWHKSVTKKEMLSELNLACKMTDEFNSEVIKAIIKLVKEHAEE